MTQSDRGNQTRKEIDLAKLSSFLLYELTTIISVLIFQSLLTPPIQLGKGGKKTNLGYILMRILKALGYFPHPTPFPERFYNCSWLLQCFKKAKRAALMPSSPNTNCPPAHHRHGFGRPLSLPDMCLSTIYSKRRTVQYPTLPSPLKTD